MNGFWRGCRFDFVLVTGFLNSQIKRGPGRYPDGIFRNHSGEIGIFEDPLTGLSGSNQYRHEQRSRQQKRPIRHTSNF